MSAIWLDLDKFSLQIGLNFDSCVQSQLKCWFYKLITLKNVPSHLRFKIVSALRGSLYITRACLSQMFHGLALGWQMTFGRQGHLRHSLNRLGTVEASAVRTLGRSALLGFDFFSFGANFRGAH